MTVSSTVPGMRISERSVDTPLRLDTATRVGNTQTWVTNAYEHDGIGDERVFTRLARLVRDTGGGVPQ
jgi:proline iminopeptidase